MLGCNLIKAGKLIIASLSEREIQLFYSFMFLKVYKGTRQKQLSGFFPLTPLTENHFAKKPLAESGGTPTKLFQSCLKVVSKLSHTVRLTVKLC